MNPYLVGELATSHIAEVRQAAATRASRRPGRRRQKTPLRHQIGFVMIEAGLRLVTEATDAGTASAPSGC